MKKLKILLVLPDGRIHKLKIGSILDISFREAPLTATTLAALVPSEIEANVKVVDESVQSIPFYEKFDLVGISCMTGTSIRGYEIADRFRASGAAVVLGGVHVSILPEEAACHGDAIVTGFAEQTWQELLRDFIKGQMKKKYHARKANLKNLPVPRRDLQKRMGYMVPNTVFVTRGCKGNCDFCSVPAAGFGWQTRPIGDVIEEIKKIKAKRFGISDVHLTQDPDYAKELFKAMIPLKKTWGALASTRIGKDDELLDLMEKSGCSYLLIGFESFNPDSLSSIHKSFNKVEQYKELIRKLHNRRIIIQGCFIFGFDSDDANCFSRTVDLVNDLKIDIPRYAVFTPYPGTRAFQKLRAEGRLLHYNWEYYDTQHVVFNPALMSPEELDEGFKWAFRETFKLKSNLQRTLKSGTNFPITFVGNLAYKIYIKRLFSEKNRFPVNPIKENSFLPEINKQMEVAL